MFGQLSHFDRVDNDQNFTGGAIPHNGDVVPLAIIDVIEGESGPVSPEAVQGDDDFVVCDLQQLFLGVALVNLTGKKNDLNFESMLYV